MKRLLLFVVLLACAGPVAAGNRAAEILGRLAEGFRAMEGYEVSFEIEAGEYRARGRYAVEQKGYCLELGDAEVFCDGSVRYEVDNARREVTIVGVDTSSHNILNNPVGAFDFLDSQYTPELVSESGGRAVVRLDLTDGGEAAAGSVTVTVDTATGRPLALDYDYDGERVHVSVVRVAELSAPIRRFDPSRCAGYEFIDFR